MPFYDDKTFLAQLDQVSRTDAIGRQVPSVCYTIGVQLLGMFHQRHVELPLPLESGNEEDPPGIYLQWHNGSVYIYEDHTVYVSPTCEHIGIRGSTDEQMNELCIRAEGDKMSECRPLRDEWPIRD